MTTLNQILAVRQGAQKQADLDVTAVYQTLQRKEPLAGITRTYRPKDAEDTDLFPAEEKIVQTKVKADVLPSFQKSWARYADIIGSVDATNAQAKADIVVDGVVLARGVPATTLLSLEKLVAGDLANIAKQIPTLDPSQNWTWNEDQGVWVSDKVESIKTKKISKPVVHYDATDKHPAQVQMGSEDVLQGYWTKTEFSGAMSATQKRALQDRVSALLDAIKVAREKANETEVVDLSFGQALLDFVFKG